MSTHLSVQELVDLLPGAVSLYQPGSMTPELTRVWTAGDPEDVVQGSAVIVSGDGGPSIVPWAVARGAAAVVAWTPPNGDARELKLAVQQALIEAQARQIERIHSIHDRLTNVALAGSGLDELARTLSEIVDNPVIIKSREHRNLAVYGSGSEVDSVRRRAMAHGATTPDVVAELERRGIFSQLRRGQPTHVEAIAGLEMAARVMAPILMGDAYYGYISIAEVHHTLKPVDMLAVEQAATVAALIFGREHAVAAHERSLRSAFVYELLFSRESADLMERRARFLGYPANQQYAVMVIRPAKVSDEPVRSLMEHVAAAADQQIHRLKSRHGGLYAIALEDTVIAIYPSHSEGSRDEWVSRGRRLLEGVRPVSEEIGLAIGIGQWQPETRGIHHSFTQARLAATVGLQLHGAGSVTHYEDLGLYRLLAEAVDAKALRAFHDEQLGAVAQDAELLRTLRVYLESRANKALAAKRLSIHLNTLKYRLQRIGDLVNRDLNDPQTLLDLHVAIEIGDLN